VVGTRRELPPFVAVQQLVDVIQRYLLAQNAAEFRVKLFGGEQVTGFSFG
jgi:hypothetical protein